MNIATHDRSAVIFFMLHNIIICYTAMNSQYHGSLAGPAFGFAPKQII